MEHLILFFALLLFMCLDLENTNVENHWRQMTKEKYKQPHDSKTLQVWG
jgi:hypothetical protein